MIRRVTPADAAAITRIYNHYVLETTVTFEIAAVTVEEMRRRIEEISTSFPYYIMEQDGEIVGYAYVHLWKERAAYSRTLETTVYLSHTARHQGIGRALMEPLIADCRRLGYRALIALITEENSESCAFHEKLGFCQVAHFDRVGEKFNRLLDVYAYELYLDE